MTGKTRRIKQERNYAKFIGKLGKTDEKTSNVVLSMKRKVSISLMCCKNVKINRNYWRESLDFRAQQCYPSHRKPNWYTGA